MRVPPGVRPEDSSLEPDVCHRVPGSAPLISSWLTSTILTFTQTKVHKHVNTHSQRQPTVIGAWGAVFGFDHLFESPDRCRCSVLSLSCSSPLCPLLVEGTRQASSKWIYIVNCGAIWTHRHTVFLYLTTENTFHSSGVNWSRLSVLLYANTGCVHTQFSKPVKAAQWTCWNVHVSYTTKKDSQRISTRAQSVLGLLRAVLVV